MRGDRQFLQGATLQKLYALLERFPGRHVVQQVRNAVQGFVREASLGEGIAAAQFLGVSTDTPAMKEAIRRCSWKGRFETVSEKPRIILDGAHNEEGIRALCRSLDGLEKPLIIVFSALRDKPGRKMASLLREHADRLIITHFENARADDTGGLAVDGAEVIENWQEAVKTAAAQCAQGTAVITGSLYFVSVARAWLTGEKDADSMAERAEKQKI
jgi:dihydrofolate synthase/folylpolyglutamate synthase